MSVVPLPLRGERSAGARDGSRALRASWRAEAARTLPGDVEPA